jgi:hypothetical protein
LNDLDDKRLIRWIANAIISEWRANDSAELAIALFHGSRYEMQDYQPAEPDVGIQCGGYCDFEFQGEDERAIMDEVHRASEPCFAFLHEALLAQFNEWEMEK